MAYVSQELKAKLTPSVKEILKKYGVKARLGVNNHRTLVLNITEGDINFAKDYIAVDRYNDFKKIEFNPNGHQANMYWIEQNFEGNAKDFLMEIKVAMNEGNHNNSRIEIDYFDVGWYVDVNIGKWNKPYVYTGE